MSADFCQYIGAVGIIELPLVPSANKLTCAKDGGEYHWNDRFCCKCGKELVPMMVIAGLNDIGLNPSRFILQSNNEGSYFIMPDDYNDGITVKSVTNPNGFFIYNDRLENNPHIAIIEPSIASQCVINLRNYLNNIPTIKIIDVIFISSITID